MKLFRGCQLSWHLKLPNIYEGVIDESVNTCCKLKLVSGWKSMFSFQVDSILKWTVYIKLKVSGLHACLWCMSQTSRLFESIAIVYELTKRTQEMLFADWAQ